MNKNLRHIIILLLPVILLTVCAFSCGYFKAKQQDKPIPKSGNNYKVVRIDEESGEVLIRTDIKYITNDKDENIVILKESRE